MNNLQTILVGSIPFVAAALLACGRRIPWTDRYGWIGAAAITWALFVGWVWHLGDTPSAPILALWSIAIGAIAGCLVRKYCTADAALPIRARPEATLRSLRSSRRRSIWTLNRARADHHRIASPGLRRSSRTNWAIALLALTVALRANAQSEPAAKTEEKSFIDRLSFVLDFDVVSAYYFRGIPQENQGFIGEPYLTISYTAFESDTWLNNLTFSFTSWNSLQTGPTGSGGQHRSPEAWYESDIVASVSATMFEKWTASAIYTAYTSPNGSYDTVEEIALKLSYDDTKTLRDFALHPYALIAFEFDDQADGGNSAFNPIAPTSEGIYLELGVAPSVPLIKNEKWPVSVTFPVTVGIGLDDYYENGSGGNTGAQFGFVDVGFDFSLPITAILPADTGAWSLRAGPHLIWLGDAPASLGQGITGGDHFDLWWKLSLSVTF